MNKKIIYFDSKGSDQGKTTSCLLLLRKLTEEGYKSVDFCIHTPSMPNLIFKNKLIETQSGILDRCTKSPICNDYTSYKFMPEFIGEDFIRSKTDFFCLLRKGDKWVLIFSATDEVRFILLLVLVLFAILEILSAEVVSSLILVTAIKDQHRERMKKEIDNVFCTQDINPIETALSKADPKDMTHRSKNIQNVEDAWEIIKSC